MLRMAWPGSAWLAAAHAATHRSKAPHAGAGLSPGSREERPRLSGYRGAGCGGAPVPRPKAPTPPPSAAQATSPIRRPRIWALSSVRSSTCPVQAACGKRHSLGLLASAQLATLVSPGAGTVGSGWRSTRWRSDRVAQSPVRGRSTSTDADAFANLQAQAPISTARSSCRSQTSPTTTSSAGSASAGSDRA